MKLVFGIILSLFGVFWQTEGAALPQEANQENVANTGEKSGRGAPPPTRPQMVPYQFAYEIQDAPTNNYQNRIEVVENGVLRGSYSYLAPDDVVRTVIYTDDGISGYKATLHEIPMVRNNQQSSLNIQAARADPQPGQETRTTNPNNMANFIASLTSPNVQERMSVMQSMSPVDLVEAIHNAVRSFAPHSSHPALSKSPPAIGSPVMPPLRAHVNLPLNEQEKTGKSLDGVQLNTEQPKGGDVPKEEIVVEPIRVSPPATIEQEAQAAAPEPVQEEADIISPEIQQAAEVVIPSTPVQESGLPDAVAGVSTLEETNPPQQPTQEENIQVDQILVEDNSESESLTAQIGASETLPIDNAVASEDVGQTTGDIEANAPKSNEAIPEEGKDSLSQTVDIEPTTEEIAKVKGEQIIAPANEEPKTSELKPEDENQIQTEKLSKSLSSQVAEVANSPQGPTEKVIQKVTTTDTKDPGMVERITVEGFIPPDVQPVPEERLVLFKLVEKEPAAPEFPAIQIKEAVETPLDVGAEPIIVDAPKEAETIVEVNVEEQQQPIEAQPTAKAEQLPIIQDPIVTAPISELAVEAPIQEEVPSNLVEEAPLEALIEDATLEPTLVEEVTEPRPVDPPEHLPAIEKPIILVLAEGVSQEQIIAEPQAEVRQEIELAEAFDEEMSLLTSQAKETATADLSTEPKEQIIVQNIKAETPIVESPPNEEIEQTLTIQETPVELVANGESTAKKEVNSKEQVIVELPEENASQLSESSPIISAPAAQEVIEKNDLSTKEQVVISTVSEIIEEIPTVQETVTAQENIPVEKQIIVQPTNEEKKHQPVIFGDNEQEITPQVAVPLQEELTGKSPEEQVPVVQEPIIVEEPAEVSEVAKAEIVTPEQIIAELHEETVEHVPVIQEISAEKTAEVVANSDILLQEQVAEEPTIVIEEPAAGASLEESAAKSEVQNSQDQVIIELPVEAKEQEFATSDITEPQNKEKEALPDIQIVEAPIDRSVDSAAVSTQEQIISNPPIELRANVNQEPAVQEPAEVESISIGDTQVQQDIVEEKQLTQEQLHDESPVEPEEQLLIIEDPSVDEEAVVENSPKADIQVIAEPSIEEKEQINIEEPTVDIPLEKAVEQTGSSAQEQAVIVHPIETQEQTVGSAQDHGVEKPANVEAIPKDDIIVQDKQAIEDPKVAEEETIVVHNPIQTQAQVIEDLPQEEVRAIQETRIENQANNDILVQDKVIEESLNEDQVVREAVDVDVPEVIKIDHPPSQKAKTQETPNMVVSERIILNMQPSSEGASVPMSQEIGLVLGQESQDAVQSNTLSVSHSQRSQEEVVSVNNEVQTSQGSKESTSLDATASIIDVPEDTKDSSQLSTDQISKESADEEFLDLSTIIKAENLKVDSGPKISKSLLQRVRDMVTSLLENMINGNASKDSEAAPNPPSLPENDPIPPLQIHEKSEQSDTMPESSSIIVDPIQVAKEVENPDLIKDEIEAQKLEQEAGSSIDPVTAVLELIGGAPMISEETAKSVQDENDRVEVNQPSKIQSDPENENVANIVIDEARSIAVELPNEINEGIVTVEETAVSGQPLSLEVAQADTATKVIADNIETANDAAEPTALEGNANSIDTSDASSPIEAASSIFVKIREPSKDFEVKPEPPIQNHASSTTNNIEFGVKLPNQVGNLESGPTHSKKMVDLPATRLNALTSSSAGVGNRPPSSSRRLPFIHQDDLAGSFIVVDDASLQSIFQHGIATSQSEQEPNGAPVTAASSKFIIIVPGSSDEAGVLPPENGVQSAMTNQNVRAQLGSPRYGVPLPGFRNSRAFQNLIRRQRRVNDPIVNMMRARRRLRRA